jgi:vancomycin permeability regulator SanA
MILEIAAGVFIGNSVSMGAIAGANLWLERKAVKAKKAREKEWYAQVQAVEDKMVAEAEATALGKFKSLEKKASNPKRTVKS